MKDVRPQYPDIDYSQVWVDPDTCLLGDRDSSSEDMQIMYEIVQGASNDDDLLAGLKATNNQLATLHRYTGLVKVPNFVELLTADMNIGKDRKHVVFAIHKEVIRNLAEQLKEFNPVVINGAVPAIKRQPLIDKFNKDPSCRVFIGNIEAAKENISLYASNDVWFLEASWTPGDNEQAANRCGLLTKIEPTFARFVTLTGSIDELIQRVNRRKAKTLSQLY